MPKDGEKDGGKKKKGWQPHHTDRLKLIIQNDDSIKIDGSWLPAEIDQVREANAAAFEGITKRIFVEHFRGLCTTLITMCGKTGARAASVSFEPEQKKRSCEPLAYDVYQHGEDEIVGDDGNVASENQMLQNLLFRQVHNRPDTELFYFAPIPYKDLNARTIFVPVRIYLYATAKTPRMTHEVSDNGWSFNVSWKLNTQYHLNADCIVGMENRLQGFAHNAFSKDNLSQTLDAYKRQVPGNKNSFSFKLPMKCLRNAVFIGHPCGDGDTDYQGVHSLFVLLEAEGAAASKSVAQAVAQAVPNAGTQTQQQRRGMSSSGSSGSDTSGG